jgi:hypothetical protein
MLDRHDDLINGRVNTTSLINEPLDFAVKEPKRETAVERARRKWFTRQSERQDDRDR